MKLRKRKRVSCSSVPRMTSAVRAAQRATATATPHLIYGPQHFEMRRSLGKYIENSINPKVDKWESEQCFPAHSLFKDLGRLGVFGMNKPVEFGGLGLDCSYSVAIAEEMGKVNCGGIPMAVAVQSDMSTPALAQFGSDRLRSEYLIPAIKGDVVSCIAVSEPGAGSDVAAIKTNARREGSDLVINGSKMWITNGTQADWACVLVNTNGKELIHRNKSLVIVPLSAPGVHRERRISKLGMHCSDTAQIFFDDVRVPESNIIGEEGRGFVYQMMQFQDERLCTIAVSLEPLQKCIDMTIEYARERKAFGNSVIDNQSVHFKMAELQSELEAVRSLLYRAVAERIQGGDVTLLASMGKLKSGRLSRQITDQCLQYWGGLGFTWDNLISRFYRDFRLFSIGAGTDEVMLSIICKYMKTIK